MEGTGRDMRDGGKGSCEALATYWISRLTSPAWVRKWAFLEKSSACRRLDKTAQLVWQDGLQGFEV